MIRPTYTCTKYSTFIGSKKAGSNSLVNFYLNTALAATGTLTANLEFQDLLCSRCHNQQSHTAEALIIMRKPWSSFWIFSASTSSWMIVSKSNIFQRQQLSVKKLTPATYLGRWRSSDFTTTMTSHATTMTSHATLTKMAPKNDFDSTRGPRLEVDQVLERIRHQIWKL